MAEQKVIIWTKSHRESVVKFMRLYLEHMEADINNEDRQYGLEDVQSGILHIADKIFPSGAEYVVKSGLHPAEGDMRIITDDDEYNAYEQERSGE